MRVLTLNLARTSLAALAASVLLLPAAEAATPEATAPATARSVVVDPGDTVYGLARRFGISPQEIIALNGLEAPYALRIGQEVALPADATDHAATTVAARVAESPVPAAPAVAPSAEAAAPAPSPVEAQTVAARPEPVRPTEAVAAPTPLQYAEAAPAAPSPKPTLPAAQPAAPVMAATGAERLDALYTVKPGDTLFSLAQRFGSDPAPLASANGLTDPYTLTVGQRLIIPAAMIAPAAGTAAPVQSVPQMITGEAAPASAPVPAEPNAPSGDAAIAARELGLAGQKPEVATTTEDMTILVSKSGNSRFSWPLRGAIIGRYGIAPDGAQNDGIKIAAPVGAPIRAAADGDVIYTGSELEGYGNLLLVRHEDGWVSAYAHTDTILVKKGDTVQQGEVVAKVGHSGEVSQPQLHFELRHQLQPRDPLAALNGEDRQAIAVAR